MLWSAWSRSSRFQTTGRTTLPFTCPGPYKRLEPPQSGPKGSTAAHKQHGRFLERVPNSPPIQGTEDPTRRRLCWTWSLRARRIGSGKRRFEAASGEVFVYFKHKPAKNSKFQGSNHLLKVRCMLKSFPGSGPLLAISIYTGKKNMPNRL